MRGAGRGPQAQLFQLPLAQLDVALQAQRRLEALKKAAGLGRVILLLLLLLRWRYWWRGDGCAVGVVVVHRPMPLFKRIFLHDAPRGVRCGRSRCRIAVSGSYIAILIVLVHSKLRKDALDVVPGGVRVSGFRQRCSYSRDICVAMVRGAGATRRRGCGRCGAAPLLWQLA